MAKPSNEDLRFFRTRAPAEAIAEAMLGLRGATREEAARALAELAADRARLGEVLAVLPGAAVVALEVIARADYPLFKTEIVRRLDEELGAGRGEAAFRALLGRGFLATSVQQGGYFGVWTPFIEPVLEVLEGLEVVSAPEPAPGGALPDRGALAIALLLGELARRRPRIAMDGSLYKRDAAEIDRLFADALGRRGAELFVVAFSRLGLTGYEETPAAGRAGARVAVEHAAAAKFLAKPRRDRVLAFARAHPLPEWLGLAFAAADRVAPREALARAARFEQSWHPDPGEVDRWIGYCVAAGVLEEVGPGLRASAEVRGKEGPARPESGRWLVQPNLEVMVPPDVPPAEAFRLACVAEIAALDRAAVLRLTPTSLARAADAGLDADGVVALLAGRSAAPLPDLAVRAVRDAVRAPRIARAFEGVVVTAPPEVASALRGRRDVDALVQLELAPGVYLLEEGAEARFAKEIAAAGGELRASGGTRHFMTWDGQDEIGTEALAELVDRAPAPPPDARLAGALARARAGEAGEFSALEQPVPTARPSAATIAAADREATRAELERLLGMARAQRARGRGPLAAVLEATAPGAEPPPAGAPPGAPVLSAAWQEAAAAAIAERRDLWLELADEGRPRLVTPHRVAGANGATVLEALAHDSGDLRAFPAERIVAAGVGEKSDAARLARTGVTPALRAARNDRCPCGSGRKYKACCLPGDLAGGAP